MNENYFIFSQTRHTIVLFLGLIVCLSLIKPLSLISTSATLFSLLLLFPLLFIARRIARATASITLSNEKIHIEWVSNFLLKSENNYSIDFSDLKDWAVDIWNDDYHYRFTLRNKTVIKLSFDKKNGDIKNSLFLYHLQQRIETFNLSHIPIVEEGKTFFQRPLAKVFAFIAAATLIFSWTSYFLTDNIKLFKLVFATIFLSTHIFFTVYQNRK